MPRIPKSEIDELKRAISLLLLVKSQGHKVKKQGNPLSNLILNRIN